MFKLWQTYSAVLARRTPGLYQKAKASWYSSYLPKMSLQVNNPHRLHYRGITSLMARPGPRSKVHPSWSRFPIATCFGYVSVLAPATQHRLYDPFPATSMTPSLTHPADEFVSARQSQQSQAATTSFDEIHEIKAIDNDSSSTPSLDDFVSLEPQFATVNIIHGDTVHNNTELLRALENDLYILKQNAGELSAAVVQYTTELESMNKFYETADLSSSPELASRAEKLLHHLNHQLYQFEHDLDLCVVPLAGLDSIGQTLKKGFIPDDDYVKVNRRNRRLTRYYDQIQTHRKSIETLEGDFKIYRQQMSELLHILSEGGKSV